MSRACFPLLVRSPSPKFVILLKSSDDDYDGNWKIITLLQISQDPRGIGSISIGFQVKQAKQETLKVLHSVAKMSLVEKLGFSGYNWKNSYTLFLLTVAYIFGEISHYLIGSLSRQMSRDIGYGDYSCFNNPNVSSSITCSSDDYKNNKER